MCTQGSAGHRLKNTADTWAVIAAVRHGLFSACTLPWWRRTSWVWLTSKSLLINQHWKISWFHTPVSQNLGHYYTPMQPNQDIRWMKWPANDSPLNTNSFWNRNIGMVLIKITIQQWSALIKGLNWCWGGERSRTPQVLQPAHGKRSRGKWEHKMPSQQWEGYNCVWFPSSLE